MKVSDLLSSAWKVADEVITETTARRERLHQVIDGANHSEENRELIATLLGRMATRGSEDWDGLTRLVPPAEVEGWFEKGITAILGIAALGEENFTTQLRALRHADPFCELGDRLAELRVQRRAYWDARHAAANRR